MNQRTIHLFSVVVIAVAALLVASCGQSGAPAPSPSSAKPASSSAASSPSSSSGASQSPAASGQPYKIGVLSEDTGPASYVGDNLHKGGDLWAEQTNKTGGIGGRPVQLVYYNTETNPEKAVVGLKKLVDDEKVVAIIGPSINGETKAVQPLVEKDGPVLIASSPSYQVPGDSYIFSFLPSDTAGQTQIFDYFKGKGWTKVGLIASNDATGQAGVQIFTKLAQDYKFDLSTESFKLDAVDVTAELTRLRQKSPDAVITWTTGQQAAIVVKGFNQLGFDIPLIVSSGNLSSTFLNLIAGNVPKNLLMAGYKSAVWQDLADTDPIKPGAKKFAELYQAKYNKPTDSYLSGLAWDAGELIKATILKVGTDPAKMKASIEGQKNWTSLNTINNYTKDDHRGANPADTVIVQVVGDQFKLVH